MNLMNFQVSVKMINKKINHNCLNANKTVLNISKTELVMFSPPKKIK